MPRPCPFVSCRYHLSLDISEGGRIKFNPATGKTCALDLADLGGMTLQDIGHVLGLTRERIRQIALGAERTLRVRLELAQTPRAAIR